MRCVRLGDGHDFEARNDRRGLALDFRQQRAAAVFLWRRHWQPAARQVSHQFQIKGQLLKGQSLEDRQNKAPIGRRQEKIRVLDARGDAVQVRQFADRELRQEARGFGASDRGEVGHWLGPKV